MYQTLQADSKTDKRIPTVKTTRTIINNEVKEPALPDVKVHYKSTKIKTKIKKKTEKYTKETAQKQTNTKVT